MERRKEKKKRENTIFQNIFSATISNIFEILPAFIGCATRCLLATTLKLKKKKWMYKLFFSSRINVTEFSRCTKGRIVLLLKGLLNHTEKTTVMDHSRS